MIKNRNIAANAGIELSKILGSGIVNAGEIFYVAPATSASFARWSGVVESSKLFTSIADAVNAAVTNRNDVIILSPDTHTITSMLTISKSRLTLVGDISGRTYGASAKIVMGVTTATTDVHAVKNIGVRNTFIGIKFDSGNTLTEHTSVVGEGGEYARYVNCEFYSGVKMDSDTFAEVLLNGDSAQFVNCTFGSIAAAVSGDKVRPAVITTGSGVASGAGVSRDVLFEGCKFWKNAGGTTTAMIKIAADDDLERLMEVKNCTFVANKLGSVPAVAIASATLSKAQVLLSGDTIALNCTKIGTATGIINGTPARVATATIGIQAT